MLKTQNHPFKTRVLILLRFRKWTKSKKAKTKVKEERCSDCTKGNTHTGSQTVEVLGHAYACTARQDISNSWAAVWHADIFVQAYTEMEGGKHNTETHEP